MRSVKFKLGLKYLLIVCASSLLLSCKNDAVYEHVQDFAKEGWADTTVARFDFEITNASTHKDLYLNVRYNNDYNFYNLYVQYILVDSTGKELVKKLDQILLYEEKLGQPNGSGIGGTNDLEVKMFYFKNYVFPYNGKYTLRLKQFMRISPLQGIQAVGLKVKEVR